MLAQHHAVGVPAHIFGTHDFIGFTSHVLVGEGKPTH
jgi:hypothetical protein